MEDINNALDRRPQITDHRSQIEARELLYSNVARSIHSLACMSAAVLLALAHQPSISAIGLPSIVAIRANVCWSKHSQLFRSTASTEPVSHRGLLSLFNGNVSSQAVCQRRRLQSSRE